MTSRILPPVPFRRSIVVRVVLVWLFVRAIASAGGGPAGVSASEAFQGNFLGSLYTMAIVVAALWVELRRRGEHLFLANLGWSFGRIAAFIVAVCVALEFVVRAAVD